MKNAKLIWYRQIQREVYRIEYVQLEAGQPLPKTSTILKLDPYFDKEDRVLRIGGRLQYSNLPEATKHPNILPHGHPVVEKIIQSVHNELLHAGPENTLSVLRQNTWLTHRLRCSTIWSDNAKTFKCADRQIRKL